MITAKQAKHDLDLGNIKKGDHYLHITGADAAYIKSAAKKVNLSGEALVNNALLMFLDNHTVHAVVAENGEAPLS